MTAPRFSKTSCSQCGREFGPGNEGFSHCSDHAPATPAADAVSRSKPLYFAVLECPHAIVADEIVLSFDSKQPGHNALNQLSRRMASASAALAQQHALELLSLDGQAMERESALVAERDALQADLQRLMDKHNALHVNAHAVRVERDALGANAGGLLEALNELADLVEDMLTGNYTPDSFTTQPARAAIEKASQCPALAAPAVEGE